MSEVTKDVAQAKAQVATAVAEIKTEVSTARSKIVAALTHPVTTAGIGAVVGRYGPAVIVAVVKHVL